MKKRLFVLAIVFVITAAFMPRGFAIDLPLRVVVNGEKMIFPDRQPYIDSQGRTMVPSRFVGEELGAEVSWDGAKNEASFEMDGSVLILRVGSEEYTINGVAKQMDTVAVNTDGRVIVPVRYVAEAFGAIVKWNDVIRTVYINLNGEPEPTPTPKKEGEKDVGGFIVPADTDVSVVKVRLQEEVEARFLIDMKRSDYEKQKADLKAMLLQKFEPDLVGEIIEHINKKKGGYDELPAALFYSAKQDQLIWIQKSVFFDTCVIVYVKGYKKGKQPV
ncbi:MAG: copper amine oxidase N-terminal domain-containing protein [Clostridium sp.]|nr:copper amine oxidase N-terminal domain-containing protein [Clostridium sp.]